MKLVAQEGCPSLGQFILRVQTRQQLPSQRIRRLSLNQHMLEPTMQPLDFGLGGVRATVKLKVLFTDPNGQLESCLNLFFETLVEFLYTPCLEFGQTWEIF